MHVDDKISFNPFFGLSLKTFPVAVTLLLISLPETFGQLKDDFSDGDLITHPTWSGMIEDFRVNENHELQLNASAAGESWLSTPFAHEPSDAVEWEFVVAQSFAPSGSNFSRFYLQSDHPDLTKSTNAYFLQFGEAGSSDAVEMFYQSGSTNTSICRGSDGAITTSFGIRVKVTYNPPDKWTLYVDELSGDGYRRDATGEHQNVSAGPYVGIFCKYTISNVTRFYFDDILIGAHAIPDTFPPEIERVDVVNASALSILFSERLDAKSVVPENFVVMPHPGHPIAATLGDEQRRVELLFGGAFANGLPSTLQVASVKDISENPMTEQAISFVFFEASPVAWKDVVITEVLADPSPPAGLPEAEFVELYNRSPNPIDLSGWHLSDATTSAELPSRILLPQKYLVLTSASAAETFSGYGEVLALTPFPSLNNAGDVIWLLDDEENVIDCLSYSSDWHTDDEKAEGGWSLELIDPNDLCRVGANWATAETPEGGTPGGRNSVHASRPDNTGPRVTSVVCIDRMTLLVSFNERLSDKLPSTAEFNFDNGIEPTEIAFADAFHRVLVIALSQPVIAGKEYTLVVGDVFDCPGNRIDPGYNRASFLLPEKAEAGDIIINEILFNPRPSGVDFIEVYNRSSKVVDMQNWSLRNWLSGSASAFALAGEHILIYPGQFYVFTKDANVLKGEYVMAVEETFYETNIPSLNDDEGSVILLDDSGSAVDTVYYSDKLHSQLLKDDEGVSLERISGAASGLERSNWRSASADFGFATPGYTNSNARTGETLEYGSVTIEPEIINPDRAAVGFARINYRFRQGGLVGNIKVLDNRGRTVRTIADNQTLGTEGFFRWDADMDNGPRAPTGYYMVWFEVFSLDGEVHTFRNRVAVF